ncbi:MAG: hypothetical protein ACL7BU_05790 [Candidatus Phlomobacter fragariae]
MANLNTKNKFDINIINDEVIGYPSTLGIPAAPEKQILIFYRKS